MKTNLLLYIIMIFILVVLVIWFVYNGRKPQAKKIILALVIEAERLFGAKTGCTKYNYVIGYVYPRLPFIIRTLISEKRLDDAIESSVQYLKKELGKEDIVNTVKLIE